MLTRTNKVLGGDLRPTLRLAAAVYLLGYGAERGEIITARRAASQPDAAPD